MGRSPARHEKIGTQTQTCFAASLLVGLIQFLISGVFAEATPLRVRFGESAQSPVRSVELEDYLVGVVGQEMNAKEFPEAALEAQAITARSYALVKQREAAKVGRSFDLQSSVMDQVYDPQAAANPRAQAAVEKTRGMILVDGNSGGVFAPYYHSTCGGRTELPVRVWGKQSGPAERYVKKDCAFCSASPRAHWESAVRQEVIAQKLGLAASEYVVQWTLTTEKGEHRISQLVALTNQGRKIAHSGQQWRALLGFEVLRSLWLEQPTRVGEVWRFRGRGAGHGVGMCQWGARGAAQQGWNAQRILKHYYPFARVDRTTDQSEK